MTPMQVGTTIASGWLAGEPLYNIATRVKMSGRDVMDVVRKFKLPDRHPVTRVLYPTRQMVEP